MKICLINNLYPPYHRGGAETVVENQVKKLVAGGHDVFVITTQPLASKKETKNLIFLPQRIYRFFPCNFISYYHLAKSPVPLRALWRFFDTLNFSSYLKIKAILKTEKPDIVYVHNLTGLGLLVPRLIKKLPIKYIQTMHDMVGVHPSGLLLFGQEKENVFIKIWTALNRFLYGSPDEVIFPSEWLKKYYINHGFFAHSKKETIKNFIIPEAGNLLSNKKLKSSNKITFLYIGQIESHKGIIFLIKTFCELSVANYELLVVGSGSSLNQAKKLAINKPQISFLGWQSADQIKKYLQQADYLIVPSLCYENSPTVIFESLSANVPVIASDLGGIPELIRARENGYLFAPGDQTELMNIINKVYDKN